MRWLTEFLRHQGGATAIEYALIASFIAVAAIVGMQNLGGGVNSMLGNVSNAL